jgi:hypothetical protein
MTDPNIEKHNRFKSASSRYAAAVMAISKLMADQEKRNATQIEAALPEFTHEEIGGAIDLLRRRKDKTKLVNINVGKTRTAIYQMIQPARNDKPLRVREFKPMRRDPFEHMKLAMLTR